MRRPGRLPGIAGRPHDGQPFVLRECPGTANAPRPNLAPARQAARALSNGVHQALVDAYGIPPDDRFHLIQQHEPHEFIYDTDYLGIHRSDDVVFIHIVASNWRDTAKKQALYAAIAANLAKSPGLRPEDVQVVLSSNERDEWSCNDVASYVKDGS